MRPTPGGPGRQPLTLDEAERLAGQVLLRVEYLEGKCAELRRFVLRTYRLVRELLERGGESPVDPQSLSPLDRIILEAAASGPLPAKRLAAEAGRSCNSHFREHLRGLVRRGLLAQGPDGYSLPIAR